MTVWSKEAMEHLSGKVVLVTGAHKEHSYESAFAFAERGAIVVLAVSDLHKGKTVRDKIQDYLPEANLDLFYLDLYEISSIRAFVAEFKSKYKSLSVLVLTEQIQSETIRTTKEGFESQFGVNYLGHFALTGLLLDYLKNTPNSRVITLGDKISPKTKLSFGHFNGDKKIKAEKYYIQSKLANLLFAKHLDQQFKKHHIPSLSICCIPSRSTNSSKGELIRKKTTDGGQSSETNSHSLPIIYAATHNALTGGETIGLLPSKSYSPTELKVYNRLYDEHVAHNLWYLSEKLCGVTFQF